jgi:hypothetical protein
VFELLLLFGTTCITILTLPPLLLSTAGPSAFAAAEEAAGAGFIDIVTSLVQILYSKFEDSELGSSAPFVMLGVLQLRILLPFDLLHFHEKNFRENIELNILLLDSRKEDDLIQLELHTATVIGL